MRWALLRNAFICGDATKVAAPINDTRVGFSPPMRGILMLDDEKLFEKVFLLGILTREDGESLDDVTKSLANTGMFDLQEGERILEQLRADGLVSGDGLTMMGVEIAKKAQQEFTEAGAELDKQQKGIS